MFHNREDAALQLAELLQAHKFQDPVVLAIPRGGVVIGSVLARELHAELDVLLCKKLRAPWRPELAIGAINENGSYFLNEETADVPGLSDEYVEEEVRIQSAELNARKAIYRRIRPAVSVAGRSVILTDDGIATGATMIAALRGLQTLRPFEVVVAVLTASAEEIDKVRCWCDEVVCLSVEARLGAISQAYGDFSQVDDALAIHLLTQSMSKQTPTERARSHGPVCLPILHSDQ